MIDHITIPVSNVEKARAFYEAAFKPLGYKISFGEEGEFWAFDIGSHSLFEISKNHSGKPITPFHFAFRVKTKKEVDDFYTAAIDAGAQDNGKPGPRPQYTEGYYACFVLDLDGYNVEAMIDTSY